MGEYSSLIHAMVYFHDSNQKMIDLIVNMGGKRLQGLSLLPMGYVDTFCDSVDWFQEDGRGAL
jgi:hypothetical protein